MQGIKHIVECHCVLPQNRNKPVTIYHSFIVFSEIDESDTTVPKFAQCNNCGVVHKVIDICKSEIAVGKEDLRSVNTIDDLKIGLPEDTCNLLESYSCDLATWEHVDFIYRNEKWDEQIILARDAIDDEIQGKRVTFREKDGKVLLRLESFISRDIVKPGV